MTPNANPAPRRAGLFWMLLVLWFAVELALLLAIIASGEMLMDYHTYARASEALAAGGSPYAESSEVAQETWRRVHRVVIAGEPAPNAAANPGPYLYPPSLALMLVQTGIPQSAFVLVLYAALLGICFLWRRASPEPGPWVLLLVILSWDVAATFSGGNVELLLIFLALLATRLFWLGHGGLAGVAATAVVLVKPFYLLLFVAFAALALRCHSDPPVVFRKIAAGLVSGAVVLGLEIVRWPPELRAEALTFLREVPAHTFLTLPVEMQRPFSDWNRAPLQILLSLGVPADTARAMAGALWAICLIAVLSIVPRGQVRFSVLFAIAWVLMVVARPITLALPFLEMFVVSAVWPNLSGRSQRVLLIGAGLLIVSHWVALILAVTRVSPALLTLQTARLPFETLIVIPVCLALCIYALRKSASGQNG